MQALQYQTNYSCPPIRNIVEPPSKPRAAIKDASSKYYREIGAEMVGNRLTITMERDKDKSRKRRDKWDPPCDCDTVEIQRPTRKEGPRLLRRNDNNRILFRIHSRGSVKEDPSQKPQAVSYEVGACKGGEATNDQCRTIVIHPQLGAPGAQVVHTDSVQDGDQSVFFLRVKKKPESSEQRKRNIELELRTPRPPTPPLTPPIVESSTRFDTGMQKKPVIGDEGKAESRKGKQKQKKKK